MERLKVTFTHTRRRYYMFPEFSRFTFGEEYLSKIARKLLRLVIAKSLFCISIVSCPPASDNSGLGWSAVETVDFNRCWNAVEILPINRSYLVEIYSTEERLISTALQPHGWIQPLQPHFNRGPIHLFFQLHSAEFCGLLVPCKQGSPIT